MLIISQIKMNLKRKSELAYLTMDYRIHACSSGLPVTIRLLDPPLHEFLPEGNIEDIVHMLSCHTNSTHEEILARIEKISEVNPMLGFRGCRSVFHVVLTCTMHLLTSPSQYERAALFQFIGIGKKAHDLY
jgi:hypothetical protein